MAPLGMLLLLLGALAGRADEANDMREYTMQDAKSLTAGTHSVIIAIVNPLTAHSASFRPVLASLHDHYKGNPHVELGFLDVSIHRGAIKFFGITELPTMLFYPTYVPRYPLKVAYNENKTATQYQVELDHYVELCKGVVGLPEELLASIRETLKVAKQVEEAKMRLAASKTRPATTTAAVEVSASGPVEGDVHLKNAATTLQAVAQTTLIDIERYAEATGKPIAIQNGGVAYNADKRYEQLKAAIIRLRDHGMRAWSSRINELNARLLVDSAFLVHDDKLAMLSEMALLKTMMQLSGAT